MLKYPNKTTSMRMKGAFLDILGLFGKKKPLNENIGVKHGQWGEETAARYLLAKGWKILERNSRPFRHDRRLEIDIVALDPKENTLIFVEVKQHKTHVEGERRLRSVNSTKKHNMRIVCKAWVRSNKWQGPYRFDVIEIFGSPETDKCEIDHIERVNIFTPRERFARRV